jgi:adenylate cyclase
LAVTDTTLPERQQARLLAAFLTAESSGLKLATAGRMAALGVIAVWAALIGDFPADFFYYAVIGGFAAVGLLQLWVNRLGSRWRFLLYVLVLGDAALMTVVLALPNPMETHWLPPGFQFHFPRFAYCFLLPVFMVLSFSPGLVLWSGVATSVGWAAGLAWTIATPGTLTASDYRAPMPPTADEALAFFSNPRFIDVQARVEEMLILLIVSGLLAFAVHRMRRLVRKQAMTERARANLARYFSPKIVDELSAVDSPFAEVRTQTVSVLFADIVGFTRQCEVLPPAGAIALLREFHLRMEQTVYEFGGTLDKYLGDGVMVTFGTPRPTPQDAVNALACARAMLDRMDAWNRDRVAEGLPAVHIGVGVHSGPVVLGDVGSDRHIEFAVIGDAVNVASRLEALTRDLAVDLVISDALAQLADAQGGTAFLVGFGPPVPQTLRGRTDPVLVRCYRQAGAA